MTSHSSSRAVALEEERSKRTITVGASAYTFNSSLQIQLPQGNVFAVSVTGPGGVALIQGTDFSIDRANGIVTALPGGAIVCGRHGADRVRLRRRGYCDSRSDRAD